MSKDKRTVATDALETLGTIHTKQEFRDAIHLAVEPVTAGEHLIPSESIKIVDGKAFSESPSKALGIVDPFLKNDVKKGESFWFILNPRLVQSLRHVWYHPAFEDAAEGQFEDAKKEAFEWIETYAESFGSEQGMSVSTEELISYAILVKGGLLEGESVSDEFWEKLEIYKGISIKDEDRNNFFSCSC